MTWRRASVPFLTDTFGRHPKASLARHPPPR